MASWLYDCTVMHRRYAPRDYGFTARMFMFLLDLDELDELPRRLPLLSRNRFNAYSFYDADHLHWGHADVRDNLRAYLRDQGVAEPVGRIRLLTSLRIFGYVFNPVSFYLCDDPEGRPLCVLAEVHNTFGELKPFLLRRGDWHQDCFHATHPKRFYISPFSDLDHDLELRVHLPTERLAMYVSDRRPGAARPFFHAALTGRRAPLTSSRLLGFSLRYPLITLKVMTLIHWHALRLWRLGVPFHRKADHPELQQGVVPKLHQRTPP